jgi:hypothetical protein
MKQRGVLTKEVIAKSMELLGYTITVPELRLMPYIMSLVMDHAPIDDRKINLTEADIIDDWTQKKYIQETETKITVNKKFWNIMCELVFLSYVAEHK